MIDITKIVKALSPVQVEIVKRGDFSGDFTMASVRALKNKGLFHLVINSPNGRCGFMELTPLGVDVQAALRTEPTGGGEG